MNCPHCLSAKTSEINAKTKLGYKHYSCQCCAKQFNERTGTKFNNIEYPTDLTVIAQPNPS